MKPQKIKYRKNYKKRRIENIKTWILAVLVIGFYYYLFLQLFI